MRDYSIVSDTMEQIIYKYMETENMSRSYGTDILITQIEIHTIQVIGDNEGINLTELSNVRHKTKSSLSKILYKLIGKNLVRKCISKESNAEINIYLTKKGKAAFEGHKEFHRNANDSIFDFLREMPEQSYNDLVTTLKKFEEFLDDRINMDEGKIIENEKKDNDRL